MTTPDTNRDAELLRNCNELEAMADIMDLPARVRIIAVCRALKSRLPSPDAQASAPLPTRQAIHDLIVSKVMGLLRPPATETRRPTIDELEAMLKSDDPAKVHMLSDGSIVALPDPVSTTVGALAAQITDALFQPAPAAQPTPAKEVGHE